MRAILLLLLGLAACDEGPSSELAYEGLTACEDPAHGTEAWFADTMKPEFFDPYCSYCHSSERQGDERHGAPEGLDYDVFDRATDRNLTTWARVASAEMPPLGALPSQEGYAQLLEFLNCTSEDTSAFEPELGACSDASLTYADAAPAFEAHCTRCHHSALVTGGDRSGATPGFDWDLPSSIRAAGVDLLWERVFEGRMPAGASESLLVTDPDDARAIHAYLSCDAPD